MTKIALFSIFMLGCAIGSHEEMGPSAHEEPSLISNPSPSDGDGPETIITNTCSEERTIWGGNCKLTKFNCEDGTFYLSSRCFSSWTPRSNLPDPPFDIQE